VNTWLAGKVKCGHCGYALMSIKSRSGIQYLRCTKRLNNKNCPGCGKVYTADVEDYVYRQIVQKFRDASSFYGEINEGQSSRMEQYYKRQQELDEEISRLLDSLAGAGETLTGYINQRVEELDRKRTEIADEMVNLARNIIIPEQLEKIMEYITNWENTGFDERRFVADTLIETVRVSAEGTKIRWKI
jgi:hypothetical protein